MTVRDPLQSPKDEMGASPKEEANPGFVSLGQVQSRLHFLEGFVGVNHVEQHYSN